jgi:hypothetical protein
VISLLAVETDRGAGAELETEELRWFFLPVSEHLRVRRSSGCPHWLSSGRSACQVVPFRLVFWASTGWIFPWYLIGGKILLPNLWAH